MAGVYVHVPYCRQACHYCDFHFSVNRASQPAMVQAMLRELDLRADYLKGETVQTIYLGGGTPSLLEPAQLEALLQKIAATHPVDPKAEITLEANPDDINAASLALWKQLGVNRLSIGIQSFHEPHLRFMNRVHTAQESLACIDLARQSGIDNISIDLIYGIPDGSHALWQADLDQALALGVPHISAYSLTIEPQTVFGRRHQRGELLPPPDDYVATQFEMLNRTLVGAGYEHYEVSNLARPGRYSRHNTSYWLGQPYLGIGPAAHSFNGVSRSHNVSSNSRYISEISQGQLPITVEELSPVDRANEYIMTSLRTQWGFRAQALFDRSGLTLSSEQHAYLLDLLTQGLATARNGAFILQPQGLLLADRVAMELFFE